MLSRNTFNVALGSLTALAATAPTFAASTIAPPTTAAHLAAGSATLAKNYGSLPLQFEQNVGQADGRVKFFARTAGSTLFLTGTQAVLYTEKPVGKPAAFDPRDPKSLMHHAAPQKYSQSVVRMNIVGATANAPVVGLAELPGKVNYFIGNDPKKWHANVATYRRVEYKGLYKNIDLAYYGTDGHVEYDFIVKPGGDASKIKLSFAGAKSMHVASTGDLVLGTTNGDVTWRKPVVYQERGGVRVPVAGSYVALGGGAVRFAVAAHDASLPLVIDPVLAYSTFLGGSGGFNGGDQSNGIAVDSTGSAYIVGTAQSIDFPTTAGAYSTVYPNYNQWVFVSKFSADGSSLVYSTFLGGSNNEQGNGIAVDQSGDAYVTGWTQSNNYPTTIGAFETPSNNQLAFVTELNPSGSGLTYSTCLGGTNYDVGISIAIDSSGDAFVAGFTGSSDFPITLGAFQTALAGTQNAFVTEMNPTGTAPVYSTYLGGASYDESTGIALDQSGDAFVAGNTQSSNFPTTAGAYQTTYTAVICPFVTEVNPSGTNLIYSTYISGTNFDYSAGIALDSAGSAYITGRTNSTDFPVTTGAFETVPTSTNPDETFVTKLHPDGSSLDYSTFVGGSNYSQGYGIAVDASGDAYITGQTYCIDFPVTQTAYQATDNGGNCVFFTKLSPTGSSLVYSTYFGGTYDDYGYAIALDRYGNAFLTGQACSADFPITSSAYQTSNNAPYEGNAFVVKFAMGAPFNVLWNHAPDNAFSLWTITDGTVTDQAYGPFDGWQAVAVASGSDGIAHILQTHAADGQISIWNVNPDYTYSYNAFGPYNGWTASDITVTPDNHVHVLWNRTDGAVSIWDMDTPTDVLSNPSYDPTNGWVATHIASGPDNHVQLLLNHTADNEAAIWDIASAGSFTYAGFGPYDGWQAIGIAVTPDNHTHLLWTRAADNAASIWDMTSFSSFTTPLYGPYDGWTAQGLATTPDGDVHVQWVGPNDELSLWDMSSPTDIANPVYGPYDGWSAVALGGH